MEGPGLILLSVGVNEKIRESCKVQKYTGFGKMLRVLQKAKKISQEITNCLVAEPDGSTPLIAKPVTAHDPEPVPSTSHPHNLFP